MTDAHVFATICESLRRTDLCNVLFFTDNISIFATFYIISGEREAEAERDLNCS